MPLDTTDNTGNVTAAAVHDGQAVMRPQVSGSSHVRWKHRCHRILGSECGSPRYDPRLEELCRQQYNSQSLHPAAIYLGSSSRSKNSTKKQYPRKSQQEELQ
eukprot:11008864-Ditylum_brightwellii.AAC.1